MTEVETNCLAVLEGKEIQSATCMEAEYHGIYQVTLICTDGTTVTIGCNTKNGGAILTLDQN
jgi:hypothetical protein